MTKCQSGNYSCPNSAQRDGWCMPHWYAHRTPQTQWEIQKRYNPAIAAIEKMTDRLTDEGTDDFLGIAHQLITEYELDGQ